MNSVHNNHLISKKEYKKRAIMIRKWDYRENGKYHNPSLKNLNKQIKTLHKKIKKNDSIYTEYSIEKDRNENKFHIHMIVYYTNEENLNETLLSYIGGRDWKIREVGLNTFSECNGKFGLINTEEIIDIKKYRDYINKINPSTSLI